jgi:hypothetical protein
MEWSDILPEKPIKHHIRPERVKVYATDALKAIQFEARLVAVAAFDMSKGRKLDAESTERLKVAVERINSALELSNG